MSERIAFLHDDSEQVKTTRASLRAMYAFLGVAAGSPSRWLYPAGGYDIFPLVCTPSVDEMTIIDAVPFLDPESSGALYSYALSGIIDSLPDGTYVNISDVERDNPYLSGVGFEEFERTVEHLIGDVSYAQSKGFQVLTPEKVVHPDHDNIAHIFASLIVGGVDLRTVQVAKFTNDYRVQFIVDGQRKTLTYRQAFLETAERSRRGSHTPQEAIANCFQSPGGAVAVLVKADAAEVAGDIIREAKPDVIVGSFFDMQTGYRCNRLADIPERLAIMHFGYNAFEDVCIGKRIPEFS